MNHFLSMLIVVSAVVLTLPDSDKNNVLTTFKSNNEEQIRQWCTRLERNKNQLESTAYWGALQMKLAQFEATPKQKLTCFNRGKVALEKAITQQNNSVEFRFLRLMIQENAPPFLKYSNNCVSDAQLIRQEFKRLPSIVQPHVRQYAKQSKVLKLN